MRGAARIAGLGSGLMRWSLPFQAIQIVRPRLHHLLSLSLVRGPVVRPTIRVAHRVGQLVLDVIRAELQNFIKDRPCHGPEPMTSHLVLGKTHATQGTQHGVVAHRAPRFTPRARENVLSVTRERLEFLQDRNCLRGQRNEVRLTHLHSGSRDVPFPGLEVDFGPLGTA